MRLLMTDRVRPLAYHLLVALLLGGLWLYADARRRTDDGAGVFLPAPGPDLRSPESATVAAEDPIGSLLPTDGDRPLRPGRVEIVGPDLLDEVTR